MQKHVNLVDLVKSFPTNIFLQNLASIQKRTSSIKFAHLAEKSEDCSISNLSTKVGRGVRQSLRRGGEVRLDGAIRGEAPGVERSRKRDSLEKRGSLNVEVQDSTIRPHSR